MIDPRVTDSCSLADLHLQLTPGTDITLLHAIGRVLIENGNFDLDFVKGYTDGFEEYKRVLPHLHSGSVLVIDDTPIDLKWIPAKHHQSSLEYEKEYGVLPGKGALIIGELEKTSRARKVWHDYNCVYVFK